MQTDLNRISIDGLAEYSAELKASEYPLFEKGDIRNQNWYFEIRSGKVKFNIYCHFNKACTNKPTENGQPVYKITVMLRNNTLYRPIYDETDFSFAYRFFDEKLDVKTEHVKIKRFVAFDSLNKQEAEVLLAKYLSPVVTDSTKCELER